MTKEELIAEILTYETPIQKQVLKGYSRQRLEDYLNYLHAMGRKREADGQVSTAMSQLSSGK